MLNSIKVTAEGQLIMPPMTVSEELKNKILLIISEKRKSMTYDFSKDLEDWNGKKPYSFTGNLIEQLIQAEPYLRLIGMKYSMNAEDYYNASPRGELFHVFEALRSAHIIKEAYEELTEEK